MAPTDLFHKILNKTFLSPSRKEQLAYMRSVPLRRLSLFGLAVFFLFTAVGLLASIRSASADNYLFTGFATALHTGLFAGLYSLIAARKPLWALTIIPVQVCTISALHLVIMHLQPYQAPVPFEQAARLYTLCALVATALSYALFFRFIQTEGRYAFRAQTELALAHTIQATLVPAIDLTLAGCQVYGLSLPSAKVGGDLVDALTAPSGDGFAYLIDVAGHGLNAGILMGMVKTAVRTCLAYESTPGKIFDTLNHILPGVKESHMYATGVALQLKPRPNGLCDIAYALAGHPPMLHLSASGEPKPRLSDEQFPLGLLPFGGYQTLTLTAAPGDLLIAATDGILETADKHGTDLGADGLETLIATLVAAHANLPLATLAHKIFNAAAHLGPQEDDRTLLLLRVL